MLARYVRPAVVSATAGAWLAAAALAVVAHAAPDAGAKAHGSYGFYGSSAHHSFSSARGHVDSYQRYLSETHGVALPSAAGDQPAPAPVTSAALSGSVDPVIARETTDAIADDIERIQRHVNRMLADAKARGDTAALAELADVDRQLGVARRGHAALHALHAEETIAPATAMELAQQVNAALRTAHAEHDEVMKRLGPPPSP